jgi:ABC-type transport system substrate-binding protein
VRRRPIEDAQKLLAEAGYPGGRDAAKGTPLVLYFDTMDTGAEAKPRLDWLRRQFGKLGVQLEIRSTDYNRFQDKMRKGTAQLYYWGWNADYPDPENFLFLFHGPQSKARFSGENASNYSSPEFDRVFERMREMENGAQRQVLVDEAIEILRRDAPWAGGFHPKDFALAHQWVYNRKPNKMANNGIKYQRIDPVLREQLRQEWNRPVLWPMLLLLAVVALSLIPALQVYRRREQSRGLAEASAAV